MNAGSGGGRSAAAAATSFLTGGNAGWTFGWLGWNRLEQGGKFDWDQYG